MKPTAEQEAALKLFDSSRDSLAIEAGAGTGKTSTLTLLANSTKRPGQYLAFNKSIVTEAGEKMPRNVACNTAHSLAWRAIVGPSPDFQRRLRESARMKSREVAARLGIRPVALKLQDGTGKRLSESYLASLTMRSVERFCQSADEAPGPEHVPFVDGIDVPGYRDNNRRLATVVAPYARVVWDDLQKPDGTLPFRHSHYLKLWQLSKPKIGADFILFDEAQDANPVMRAVVAEQTHAQVVWVGDSQQQIYSFTGAVNALQEVATDHRAFLTQSFRFGPAVADVANEILDALDADIRLTGLDSIPSRVEPVAAPNVILTRTNAEAIREVLAAIAAGRSVALVGGTREIVSFALAAKDLQNGRGTTHPELACFDDWDEVREYVEHDEQGGELRLLVKLVDDFGVGTILEKLKRLADEKRAELVVSTAHKSKGREWDTVKLAGDFPAEPTGEELRLLYVAVTRARLALDVSGVGFFSVGRANGSKPLSGHEPEPVAGSPAEPSDDESGAETQAPAASDEAAGDDERAWTAREIVERESGGQMHVRIKYAVDVDEHYRRAVNAFYGKPGLATRSEIQDWFHRFGTSMDDDLAAYGGDES